MFFLELKSREKATVNIGTELFGESALYVLEGTVTIEGNDYGSKQLLVAKNAQLCQFEMREDAVVYIFGGEPFSEERYMFWIFVSSDKEKIEKAKQNWMAQNYEAFPKVIGDENEFVPLPKSPLRKG